MKRLFAINIKPLNILIYCTKKDKKYKEENNADVCGNKVYFEINY